MGKNVVEIIPPSRLPANTGHGAGRELSSYVARENPGGIISSTLTRWEAERHARVYGALAARTRAEADYFDAQSGAIESYIKRAKAGYRLAELPEILATDRARRRADRAEELREIQHQRDLAETRRRTEMAHLQSTLVDAEQALQAQRDHGYLTHSLAWKRKHCELLNIELDAAERRALLREVQNPTPAQPLTEDELIEQLHARREQLASRWSRYHPYRRGPGRRQKAVSYVHRSRRKACPSKGRYPSFARLLSGSVSSQDRQARACRSLCDRPRPRRA